MVHFYLVSIYKKDLARNFDFRGAYKGFEVEIIQLVKVGGFEFEIGQVYLLYLKEVKIIEPVVFAELIWARPISEAVL